MVAPPPPADEGAERAADKTLNDSTSSAAQHPETPHVDGEDEAPKKVATDREELAREEDVVRDNDLGVEHYARRIFVGGFPPNTVENELSEIFEKFGEIVDLNIVKDPMTRMSKGFGFITFSDRETATGVIEQTRDAPLILNERKLNIGAAVRKVHPAPGSSYPNTHIRYGPSFNRRGGGQGMRGRMPMHGGYARPQRYQQAYTPMYAGPMLTEQQLRCASFPGGYAPQLPFMSSVPVSYARPGMYDSQHMYGPMAPAAFTTPQASAHAYVPQYTSPVMATASVPSHAYRQTMTPDAGSTASASTGVTTPSPALNGHMHAMTSMPPSSQSAYTQSLYVATSSSEQPWLQGQQQQMWNGNANGKNDYTHA